MDRVSPDVAADGRTRPAVTDAVVVGGFAVAVLVVSLAVGQAPVANGVTAFIVVIVLLGFAASAFIELRDRFPADVYPQTAPVAYRQSVFEGLLVLAALAVVTVLAAWLAPVGVILSLAIVGLFAGRLVRIVSWERRHDVTLVDDPHDTAAYIALRRPT